MKIFAAIHIFIKFAAKRECVVPKCGASLIHANTSSNDPPATENRKKPILKPIYSNRIFLINLIQ